MKLIYPWQYFSKLFSLNFIYKLDFSCDSKKILDEYYNWSIDNKLFDKGVRESKGLAGVCLYSEDGKSNSFNKEKDIDTIPTEIIHFFPYTNEIIKSLIKKFQCNPRRIRILVLKSKSKLSWHVDWDESYKHQNCRLHIPILINNHSYGNLCHQEYRWKPGELWYGEYSFPHQVINNGDSDRLHLVLDFKNPKNLFPDIKTYNLEEARRRKLRVFIMFLFNFFYLYPMKLFYRKSN